MKYTILALVLVGIIPLGAISQSNNKPTKSHSMKNMKTETVENKTTEAQSFTDYEEVIKAITPYIESAHSGDGKLCRTAFYDHAHILGSVGGKVYNMDADQFAEAVQSGGPAENVRHQIAWIDISGPAAAAKVEFIDWNGMRYTDFFVLYKQNGKWLISGKVYNSHSNN